MEKQLRVVIALLALTGSACAAEVADIDEVDPELQQERQDYVDSINGLKSVNGLKSINGLKTMNGMKTVNGLRTVNGLSTSNGLKTVNGMRTVNGLRTVNGASTTLLGATVTAPDGILSRTSGMMASNDGIATAKYMVRCALPAGRSMSIKDYTGATVSLAGELGLAPQWETGQCDTACQEKITACLMALSNGTGAHVNVALAAHDTLLKPEGPSGWPQEAAFFGNMFFGTDEPEKGGTFYCQGEATYDANHGILQSGYRPRGCQGYATADDCPYEMAYEACNSLFAKNACSEASHTMKGCKDESGRAWAYAITTFVAKIDQY